MKIIQMNITTCYFDGKGHPWSERLQYFLAVLISFLSKGSSAIFCLQETTPEQVLDLLPTLDEWGYDAYSLAQSTFAGQIKKNEEIKDWLGANMGGFTLTFLIPRSLQITSLKGFWMSETPEELPGEYIRGQTDQGFGNTNSARWFFVLEFFSKSERVVVFNTHLPLDGGNKARIKCMELFYSLLQKYYEGAKFVLCGDLNTIPDKHDSDEYNLRKLLDLVHNNPEGKNFVAGENENHEGLQCSWLGFSYDPFKKDLKDPKGQSLSWVITNIPMEKSFFDPCAYDEKLLSYEEYLERIDEFNETRRFVSDHALLSVTLDV